MTTASMPERAAVDGKALRVTKMISGQWQTVASDLWKDFGDFTITGMTFHARSRDVGFDQIYFAKERDDLKTRVPLLLAKVAPSVAVEEPDVPGVGTPGAAPDDQAAAGGVDVDVDWGAQIKAGGWMMFPLFFTGLMAIVSQAAGDLAARDICGHLARIYPLSVIASLSPILGLLGTIIGMIEAFALVSLYGDEGGATILSDSISKARITAAAGLIIAAPSIAIYFVLKNRIMRLASLIEVEVVTRDPYSGETSYLPIDNLDTFLGVLRRSGGVEVPLEIAAGRDVPVERVIEVFDRCQLQGFIQTRVRLGSDPEAEPEESAE